MWTYSQSTGGLATEFGVLKATGYSGHGDGVNNSSLQNVESVGPIPQGIWDIEGPPFQHPTAGQDVLRLNPRPETQIFGRSGFLIHGDKIGAVGQNIASDGCIILDNATRWAIWDSGDLVLEVIT